MPGAAAPPGGHFLPARSPSQLRKGSQGGKTHDCVKPTCPGDRDWEGRTHTHTHRLICWGGRPQRGSFSLDVQSWFYHNASFLDG